MGLLDDLTDHMKTLSWILGAVLLIVFVIAFFIMESGSTKEEVAKDAIFVLMGYVIGHPIGAQIQKRKVQI